MFVISFEGVNYLNKRTRQYLNINRFIAFTVIAVKAIFKEALI